MIQVSVQRSDVGGSICSDFHYHRVGCIGGGNGIFTGCTELEPNAMEKGQTGEELLNREAQVSRIGAVLESFADFSIILTT